MILLRITSINFLAHCYSSVHAYCMTTLYKSKQVWKWFRVKFLSLKVRRPMIEAFEVLVFGLWKIRPWPTSNTYWVGRNNIKPLVFNKYAYFEFRHFSKYWNLTLRSGKFHGNLAIVNSKFCARGGIFLMTAWRLKAEIVLFIKK